MEGVNIKFYIDLNKLKRSKDEGYYESVNLLIEYVRIVTAIHRGTFDMFHMDGYGPDGIEKIEVAFKSFESFTEFMSEKWIPKLNSIAITSNELLTYYRKKEEVPE